MGELFVNKSLEDFRDLLSDLDTFIEQMPGRFNRTLFKRVRRQTGTQSEWADAANVSQATIGNWERGYTPPQGQYRYQLRQAAIAMRDGLIGKFGRGRQGFGGSQPPIDIAKTDQGLRNTILRAALTDFNFNPITAKIVAVPFESDYQRDAPEVLEEDRQNLLESLAKFAELIVESISDQANINDQKFSRYVKSYAEEARSEIPNARLLNRLGATISRITNSDDFRDAVNTWDAEAVDGFNRDHVELMRLYFREALAKAQEVDAAGIDDVATVNDGAEFRSVAELMEAAVTESGAAIVEDDIPILLRDIANEVRDLDEAEKFTGDPERRRIFQRRKSEAFKNGGIYVGRFVFFSALISSLALPGVPEIVGTIASIVGLSETFSPGTIRAQYEKLREKFPALPGLPTSPKDDNKDQKADDIDQDNSQP